MKFPELSLGVLSLPATNAYVLILNTGYKTGELRLIGAKK